MINEKVHAISVYSIEISLLRIQVFSTHHVSSSNFRRKRMLQMRHHFPEVRLNIDSRLPSIVVDLRTTHSRAIHPMLAFGNPFGVRLLPLSCDCAK